MIQMTMQVPDELARRIQPISTWLPTIIELSLLGLQTPAAATANELIRFLSRNPSSQELLNYHVSDETQRHLRRLLALNEQGMLSEREQKELDELEQLEHVIIMLKARLARHN